MLIVENKYKEMKWEKNSNYIWNLMLLGHIIFLLVIMDDVKIFGESMGVQPLYIFTHVICSIGVYILILSEVNRKKYYEPYFTLVIPILMINGAYHYHINYG